MASSLHDSPENTHMSAAEMEAVMSEARSRKVSVMAHAHGARGIEMCAKAGEHTQ
jgi:imidazolonepropionase-like amidohydrolase